MPLFAVYLPVIYLFLKRTGIPLHLAMVAFLVLVAKTSGLRSLEFLGYLLNGVVFGYLFAWSYRRRLPIFHCFALSLLPGLLFLTLCTEVPSYHQAYTAMMAEGTRLLDGKFGLPAMTPELEALQRDWLFPAGEIFKDALTVLLLAWLFARSAGRERPRFSEFEVPDGFIWALAAGLLLALSGRGGRVSDYWLMIVALSYILGGFAVVRLFYEHIGRSRFAEAFFYLVQPFLMFVPVVVIGLLQTWLGFRKRIQSWQPPKNPDNNSES
jgi:hypothetical protein